VADGVKHAVRNSVAFDNKVAGFYANHHPTGARLLQQHRLRQWQSSSTCAASRPGGSPVNLGRLRNNLSYGAADGKAALKIAGADSASNAWDLGLNVTAAEFESVSSSGWDAPRQADGSLPVLPTMRPRAGSALAGLGAFEPDTPLKGSRR
jgi:hypothetical protein